IDDLDKMILNARHRRQVHILSRTLGWRMHRFPVQVHDALDTLDQEALSLTVIFGDDDKTAGHFRIRNHWLADGHAHVHDRYGFAADMLDAAYDRVAFGNAGQSRALQDFFDVEDVDAVDLPSPHTEKKQLQPVLTAQLSSLVYTIKSACHLRSTRMRWPTS